MHDSDARGNGGAHFRDYQINGARFAEKAVHLGEL
jgi:hypothetical protein